MMKTLRHLLLGILALLVCWTPYGASARGNFISRIPNGSAVACTTCHIEGGGRNCSTPSPFGSCLDAFGGAFDANGRRWDASLAAADSDGDGWSNGQELQDPFGQWRSGDPDPGVGRDVTKPGKADDTPSIDPCANPNGNDCDADATCSDADPIDGVFTCTCNPGYAGVGHTLVDTASSPFSFPYSLLDAAIAGCTSACDDPNVCRQDLGNSCTPDPNGTDVTCTCADGFTDDGSTCIDVDECSDGSADCATNEACVNKPGGFACEADDEPEDAGVADAGGGFDAGGSEDASHMDAGVDVGIAQDTGDRTDAGGAPADGGRDTGSAGGGAEPGDEVNEEGCVSAGTSSHPIPAGQTLMLLALAGMRRRARIS